MVTFFIGIYEVFFLNSRCFLQQLFFVIYYLLIFLWFVQNKAKTKKMKTSNYSF